MSLKVNHVSRRQSSAVVSVLVLKPLNHLLLSSDIDASHALLQPDCRNKVVLLPHIGSGTIEARKAMADMTINNLLGALGLRTDPDKEHTMDSEL